MPDALRSWRARGIEVFVYSSGSILAQRLWFGHTSYGDLTGRLCGYFDTRTAGPKREVSSYRAITARIGVPPGRTLFVSDTPGELDAARGAGWRTVQVVRAEDGTEPAPGHPRVTGLHRLVRTASGPAAPPEPGMHEDGRDREVGHRRGGR